MTPMQIKTPRLILLPLGTEFLTSSHEYCSDTENTKYMMHLPNEHLYETRAFLVLCEQEWQKHDPSFYEFAVTKDSIHIGAVSLYLSHDRTKAELGWILHPSHHGNGYTTEAAAAVMDFARNTIGVHAFIAHCDTENVASERVMQKLGMKKVSVSGGRKNKGSDEERYEFRYELDMSNNS